MQEGAEGTGAKGVVTKKAGDGAHAMLLCLMIRSSHLWQRLSQGQILPLCLSATSLSLSPSLSVSLSLYIYLSLYMVVSCFRAGGVHHIQTTLCVLSSTTEAVNGPRG